MPSPFPGMDPYLEVPPFWRGLHNTLIPFIASDLNTDLPPGFAAYTEERLYVVPLDQEIISDVLVTQRPAERSRRGSAAVADRADPPNFLTVHPHTERELFIEIRAGRDPKRVVAIIEILSPSNKAAGSVGRQEYREKQRDVLAGDIHLLEIDLLRQGAHTVAIPRAPLLERGTWDYLVSLSRSERRSTFAYWTISVREHLPRVLVPLTEGYEDVVLDLQSVFDRAYDAGPYRREVDYSADLLPPLQGEDAMWMDALLREKGLRE